MNKEKKKFWETIISSSRGFLQPMEFTSRAKVPDGWLLRCAYIGASGKSAHSITFIPDRENAWHVVDQPLKWELIKSSTGGYSNHKTFRLKVPGGWVVRDAYYVKEHLDFSMVFMSDPDHSWDLDSETSVSEDPMNTNSSQG